MNRIVMDKERLRTAIVAVKKKKKIIIAVAIVLCICTAGISGYAIYNDDRPVAPTDLPESITKFVAQYFPGRQITGAEIDFMDYEVWLDDHTHIEFDWSRKWEKIESFGSVICPELIPPAIMAYVGQNLQGGAIHKIAKEFTGYEVKVSGTGYEYKFGKSGQYRYMEWDD